MNFDSAIKSVVHSVQKATGLSQNQILTPYYWIPYNLYKSGRAWRPLFVTLELTYLCNLRCQMCSLVTGGMVTKKGQMENPELVEPDGSLRKEVTTEEYLELIRQMGRAGVRAVKFTGGEPLLRRDILTLAEAVKKQGMHLSVISNGVASSETYLELIRIGLNSVTISIDGTREVHEFVRAVPGSFERAIQTIQTIVGEKKRKGLSDPKLEVSCAISALNQHDIENVAELFQSHEIDHLNFGYLHFSTSERQAATEAKVQGPVFHLKRPELPGEVVSVDPAALARRVEQIKARRNGHRVPVKFTPDLNAEEIRRQYTDPQFTFTNKCFHPWFSTRIDPWGQMYPCWIDVRLGDVRKHSFLGLWNGEAYRNFRKLVRKEKLLPKCTTCCLLTDRNWDRLPALRS